MSSSSSVVAMELPELKPGHHAAKFGPTAGSRDVVRTGIRIGGDAETEAGRGGGGGGAYAAAAAGGSGSESGLAGAQDSLQHEIAALPPVDRGKDAWLFLAASFVLEALVWGFPFVFGVFHDHYSTHEPFAGSPNIAVVGTCAMGVMYLDIPLIMGIQQTFPRQTRCSPVVGLFTMCLSLAMSSFAATVPQLIATQGVLYAVGGSIAYGPCILYMEEWFAARKGLAYGIMWSGTGLAGFALPLLMTHWLDAYGFRTTLRIWAVALFVLTAPLAYFIKPRLPHSASTHVKPLGFLPLLGSRIFLLHQLGNVAEALGFFLPTIYLPSYARSVLGAGSFPAALTVLLVNVASVFGCVAMGSLIDRFHVTTCILISTLGTVLGTMLLWGFSVNLPLLYVFCIVYGLFAGCYTTCWPGIMRAVTRGAAGGGDQEKDGAAASASTAASSTMIFAFLAAGRGVGNVASGPLSEVLVKHLPWQGEAVAGYGSGYGALIVFTGVTAALGGSSFLWKRIGWL